MSITTCSLSTGDSRTIIVRNAARQITSKLLSMKGLQTERYYDSLLPGRNVISNAH